VKGLNKGREAIEEKPTHQTIFGCGNHAPRSRPVAFTICLMINLLQARRSVSGWVAALLNV